MRAQAKGGRVQGTPYALPLLDAQISVDRSPPPTRECRSTRLSCAIPVILSISINGHPAVRGQDLAGDIGRRVGREEDEHRRDFLRLGPAAERNAV